MCKYCEYVEVTEQEKCNNVQFIDSVKDGLHSIDLSLYRYETDRSHHAELIMDYNVVTDNGYSCTIKEKHIKIKYCPFCGEKL